MSGSLVTLRKKITKLPFTEVIYKSRGFQR